MRRNPSIHVTLTDFIKILTKAGVEDPKDMAVYIMRLAVPYAIKDRYIVQGNSQTRKQVQKHIKASQTATISVDKFNSILMSLRLSAGHQGAKVITQGSKEYLLLKEVAAMACEFADTFNITPVHEACRIFISMGLDYMKYGHQYSLGKFKYYREKIYAKYEAATVIEADEDKQGTKKVHDIWSSLLAEYSGLARELKAVEEYVVMVYVKLEAENVGADPEHWLRAQFDYFTFLDTAPNLNQLIGDKALARYYDWMASKKKNFKPKKNLPGDQMKSDFKEKYFSLLREKNASSEE